MPPSFLKHTIVAFIFLGTASAQSTLQTLPNVPGAVVTNLTPDPGTFTEPSIAVNPNDPRQVVAAYQDNVHIAYSQDFGQHWNAAEGVAPPNYKISGDVSVTYDNKGRAFVCYIAFDKLGTVNYWAHGATRNGIFLRRSSDGGKTWEANHFAVAEQPNQAGIPFEDKPIIVADNTSSRFAGNLYVGWTRWRIADSQMVISRSTDGGATWSQPIEIDPHPGLPRDDNGATEGFDGAVGPDGALYTVWSQDDALWFSVSNDGGRKFSRAHAIIHTAPIMYSIDTLERANGFPQIGIDPKSGRLFVSWSDYRNGDLDVFVASSDNRGKKWSEPVRVNNDAVHDGAEQFFPWMAVDPVEGSVNVIFYDRRGDPKEIKQTVTLARSTDGGKTFANYGWTTQGFTSKPDTFFGDYNGVAAFGGRVYGVWTELPIPPPASEPAKARESAEVSGQQPATPPPDKPLAAKDAAKAPAVPKGTMVKVGVADFGSK